jgi:hypothetical protein
VDFQIGSIQTFKLLLKKGLVEHVITQAKSVATEEGWRTVVNKTNMWKRPKATFFAQVQSMKNGNQCPILKPSLVPLIYLENDVCT